MATRQKSSVMSEAFTVPAADVPMDAFRSTLPMLDVKRYGEEADFVGNFAKLTGSMEAARILWADFQTVRAFPVIGSLADVEDVPALCADLDAWGDKVLLIGADASRANGTETITAIGYVSPSGRKITIQVAVPAK